MYEAMSTGEGVSKEVSTNRTRVFVAIEAIKTKMTFFSKNPNFLIAPTATKTSKGYIRGLFCHLFLSADLLKTIFQ